MTNTQILCICTLFQNLFHYTSRHYCRCSCTHGTGHCITWMGFLHRHHAGKKIDFFLFYHFSIRSNIIICLSYESHFRDSRCFPCRFLIVTDQSQLNSSKTSYCFQKFQLFLICIYFFRKFLSAKSQILCLYKYKGISCVNDGHFYGSHSRYFQHIYCFSRWKKSLFKGSSRIYKF